MRETLQNRCRLFVSNRDVVKSAVGWQSGYLYPLSASLYAVQNREADGAELKRCRALLKGKTGAFSNFRGVSELATITELALSAQPEVMLERMLYVYGKLKEVFWSSEHLVVAAAAVVNMGEPDRYDFIAADTRTIYNRMKEAHPMLTTGGDSAFAALLALSGLDAAQVEQQTERCYALLKPSFFSGNSVQSLSHVLALGEESAELKCAKALELFSYLKERGYKYGTSYELPTLGALALLDADMAALAGDMMDADDYLKGQKGFGAFGIGAKQRLMYSGILTMSDYAPGPMAVHTAALNGVVSLVIAQQAAICASIAAASAAAAASSSSS